MRRVQYGQLRYCTVNWWDGGKVGYRFVVGYEALRVRDEGEIPPLGKR